MTQSSFTTVVDCTADGLRRGAPCPASDYCRSIWTSYEWRRLYRDETSANKTRKINLICRNECQRATTVKTPIIIIIIIIIIIHRQRARDRPDAAAHAVGVIFIPSFQFQILIVLYCSWVSFDSLLCSVIESSCRKIEHCDNVTHKVQFFCNKTQ